MKKIFLTGGTGYVGNGVIDVASQLGYDLTVLTRSQEKAQNLRERGIEAIVGDLLSDGYWQDVLSTAEYVIHLAAPPSWGEKVTQEVANNYGRGHYDIAVRLLNNINPKTIKKIVFVAGTSYYGDTGNETAKDETFAANPRGWGPYIEKSVNKLTEYIDTGLPIVTAFPAQIYGPSSWMVQLLLEPISNQKPIYRLEGANAYYSPVHVHDCARACLFLAENGIAGERYLICDDEPMPYSDFKKIVETALGKVGNVIHISKEQAIAAIGPVLADYSTSNNFFCNHKLKDLGFKFRFPTAHKGVPHVVDAWKSE